MSALTRERASARDETLRDRLRPTSTSGGAWHERYGAGSAPRRSDAQLLEVASRLPRAHRRRGRPFSNMPVIASSALLHGTPLVREHGWDPERTVQWHLTVGLVDASDGDLDLVAGFQVWCTRTGPGGYRGVSSWESSRRLAPVLRAFNTHVQDALEVGYAPELPSGPLLLSRAVVTNLIGVYPRGTA